MKGKMVAAIMVVGMLFMSISYVNKDAAACPKAQITNVRSSYCSASTPANICFTLDATWTSCDKGPYTYVLTHPSGATTTYTTSNTTRCFSVSTIGAYTIQASSPSASTGIYNFTYTGICQE